MYNRLSIQKHTGKFLAHLSSLPSTRRSLGPRGAGKTSESMCGVGRICVDCLDEIGGLYAKNFGERCDCQQRNVHLFALQTPHRISMEIRKLGSPNMVL